MSETTYEVVYKDWDGTVLKSEQVLSGASGTPPEDPVRAHYTFTGWDRDVTSVIADLVVHALYEPILHTVVFRDYNEVVLSTQSVLDGGTALSPLPPKREGFVFEGWDTPFDNVTEDIITTARYTVIPYKTVIRIYDERYSLVRTIRRVTTANYRDTLDGELTFSFTTLAEALQAVRVGFIAEYDGDYFQIVRVVKSISNGIMMAAVTGEHISYVLNDERYALDSFDFEGAPVDGLVRLLQGTQFSPGTVDFTDPISVHMTSKVSRRQALMQFIALLGGEIEYEGHSIGIRRHRGSTARKPLMQSKNVADISATYDSRSMTASYEISFHRVSSFAVGDEVDISFLPLGLDSQARIISLEYNPFYRRSVRVEVGDYVPTIDYALFESRETQKVEQELGDLSSQFADLETDFGSLQSDVSGLYGMVREVQNISVASTQFTVSFVDGSVSTYSYTVDDQGRMTSITKVVG